MVLWWCWSCRCCGIFGTTKQRGPHVRNTGRSMTIFLKGFTLQRHRDRAEYPQPLTFNHVLELYQKGTAWKGVPPRNIWFSSLPLSHVYGHKPRPAFFVKEGRKVEGEKDWQESVTEGKGYIRIPTLITFDPVPFKRLNSPSMGTTQQLFHQLESRVC